MGGEEGAEVDLCFYLVVSICAWLREEVEEGWKG